MTFVVFALPRSRTAWTSAFLSYGGWHCTHDEARYFRSMEDMEAFFRQPMTGSVETAAAPWWRFLRGRDVRVATIRRPAEEVIESVMRLPLPFDVATLRRTITQYDRKLEQIEDRLPNVMSVQFDHLARWPVAASLFEHCLPFERDIRWYHRLNGMNIQANVPAMMRYLEANAPQIVRMMAAAKQRTVAAMQPEANEIDGLTIQQEPFEAVLRDGVHLFRDHSAAVGEHPDSYLGKNLDLMRTLEAVGALQFTTARCNGRMFGYLQAVLSPSLESPAILTAVHTLFFTSRDAPSGLGMKLQRASIEALRARGATEVAMRAGTRGSGPKMGALYRRLGAVSTGELYLLDLKDAA
jgi:hypothetical protein